MEARIHSARRPARSACSVYHFAIGLTAPFMPTLISYSRDILVSDRMVWTCSGQAGWIG